MKIEFLEDYLYFQKGEIIELDDFTIVTGVNGAGKTQFLNTFRYSELLNIDGEAHDSNNIGIYSYNDFSYYKSEHPHSVTRWRSSIADDYWKGFKKSKESNIEYDHRLQGIADTFGKKIEDLTEDDFKSIPLNNNRDEIKIFDLNFFKDTASYLSHKETNKFAHFKNIYYGENNLVYSEEQFEKRYGVPPWIEINEIFEELNLNYRLDVPVEDSNIKRIELRLIDIVNDIEVDLQNLSNGELTILSIISFTYNYKWKKDVLPKIFLFDEIDAFLHPMNSKKVLDVIKTYLVEKLGRKVILVTHSPSTVALAPIESFLLFKKKGFVYEKVSKDEALSHLTYGIPSLSILHENRRQVFVEDEVDAKVFERVSGYLNNFLDSEISLNFIPVSVSGVGGCDSVKTICKSLLDSGNNRVFGIVDWDLKNKSNDNVFVLGEGRRYSIENFIFDPIVFYTFMLRELFISSTKNSEYYLGYRHLEISSLPEKELQKISAIIVDLCLDFQKSNSDLSPVTLEYVNGKSISVPKWFLEIQGHELEEHLISKFNELKRYQKKLKLEVMNKVFGDSVGFISVDFLNIFYNLQAI